MSPPKEAARHKAGPPTTIDAPATATSSVTVPDGYDVEAERAEWRDRFAAMVQATRKQRELREQIRRELAVARSAGLRARYDRKARRSA